jgi:hypothetical protein
VFQIHSSRSFASSSRLAIVIVIVAEFGAVFRDVFWMLGSWWQVWWTGQHNSSTVCVLRNLGGFPFGCNGNPFSLIAV